MVAPNIGQTGAPRSSLLDNQWANREPSVCQSARFTAFMRVFIIELICNSVSPRPRDLWIIRSVLLPGTERDLSWTWADLTGGAQMKCFIEAGIQGRNWTVCSVLPVSINKTRENFDAWAQQLRRSKLPFPVSRSSLAVRGPRLDWTGPRPGLTRWRQHITSPLGYNICFPTRQSLTSR